MAMTTIICDNEQRLIGFKHAVVYSSEMEIVSYSTILMGEKPQYVLVLKDDTDMEDSKFELQESDLVIIK
jgi:hypothetical protein